MKLTIPANNNDHAKGRENAPITLLEYGDFECPYCKEAFPIVKDVQKIVGNNLKFVFRNFPLSEIHPHAINAAYAAEAAARQGKFWEMHSLLFENQDALSEQDLMNYAKTIKMDIGQFNKDMRSQKIINKVKDDFISGVKSGVNGTPTFFINNVRFDQPHEKGLLLQAINSAKNFKKRVLLNK